MTQRWREGRDSYRPTGEPIDPRRFGVEVVQREQGAAFVRGHHYSRSCAPARITGSGGPAGSFGRLSWPASPSSASGSSPRR